MNLLSEELEQKSNYLNHKTSFLDSAREEEVKFFKVHFIWFGIE